MSVWWNAGVNESFRLIRRGLDGAGGFKAELRGVRRHISSSLTVRLFGMIGGIEMVFTGGPAAVSRRNGSPA